MANDGYIGEAPAWVKCPGTGVNLSNDRGVQGVLRSRHETLNGRLKFWEILKQPFWQNIVEHGEVFWAIAVVIQLGIDEGDKLFSADNSD